MVMNSKLSILPTVIYSFSTIPILIPMIFSAEIGKNILNFKWNSKGSWRGKTIPKRQNKIRDVTLLDFKTQWIKTTYNWQKDSQKTSYTESRNRPTQKWFFDNHSKKTQGRIFFLKFSFFILIQILNPLMLFHVLKNTVN